MVGYRFRVLTLGLIACIFNHVPDEVYGLQGDADRPNVIFMMSDDQGFADLGCYGSPHLQTPNLDRMAGEGIRFMQAYVGSPVCAPTRCSLMTGLHSGHITRRGNRTTDDAHKPFMERKLVPLRSEDYTIGDLMKEGGYHTACIGKWGLGNPGTTGTPDQHGFDYFYGYLDQVHAHNYYTNFLMENLDSIPISANENDNQAMYTPDLLLDKAKDFIREKQDDPFFLYLPFTLPHGRYVIPDQGIYADKPWPEKIKNYAAMITYLDDQVGQILNLLNELEIDEKTLIFFCSDNGPNPEFVRHLSSNQPFRGLKRQVLEGGIRTPMIVRWPGTILPKVDSVLVWAFWDLMPTLADLLDTDLKVPTDGISIMPTLLGLEQGKHEFLYWEFYDPFQQAVRLNNFKGIRLGTEEPIHLYDLQADLSESNNIADQHPDIIQKMVNIMSAEHSPSPHWPPEPKASDQAKKWLR